MLKFITDLLKTKLCHACGCAVWHSDTDNIKYVVDDSGHAKKYVPSVLKIGSREATMITGCKVYVVNIPDHTPDLPRFFGDGEAKTASEIIFEYITQRNKELKNLRKALRKDELAKR